MQTMELVDIEDVYPYEENDVRMNPRDVETKECREYIAQLAEQFKRNRLNPGQPRVRPILYRDGGIYMIVDGECRYWAMKSIGTRKFYADVFDDLADAETARREAAKAMVETDCKRPLTPEEMSRGVQTMLELDLPDEEVAASARIDVGRVRKARRGARAASDASYDMTLERLMAIAEFEGDPEAVARLRDCAEKDWRRVYSDLSFKRKAEEAVRAAREALEAAGLSELDGDRAGYRTASSTYVDGNSDPLRTVEKVESALESCDPPCTHFTAGGHWVELLRAETDEERAEAEAGRAAEEEANRARQRHRELWEAECGARERWIAERLEDPRGFRSLRATAAALTDRAMDIASGPIGRTGAQADFSPTPALALVGLGTVWVPDAATAAQAAMGGASFYMRPGCVEGFLALADAMAADGYGPNETGAAVIAALREWEERNGR